VHRCDDRARRPAGRGQHVAQERDPWLEQIVTEQDRDRRRIFVAIAQGMVEHLHDHQGAFRVAADSPLPINIRIEIDRTS